MFLKHFEILKYYLINLKKKNTILKHPLLLYFYKKLNLKYLLLLKIIAKNINVLTESLYTTD